MTHHKKASFHLIALVAGLWALCASSSALAQTQEQQAPAERPVYLDIQPLAGAGDAALPEDVVGAMAREALADMQQATIRVKSDSLPTNARVLRILYIVHRQPQASGMTLAASASTALLRTAIEGDGGVQTFSVYSGLQQTLVQGPDERRATARLRTAFRQALQARIGSAFDTPGAR